ncbi:hypothetical protein [Rubrivirga sp. IMCC45206]|uniref:hypothetical protein n=1 Tax=Rubrivirga sp. IMCC45206 TaxID=3391614 RepID=UPI0039900995
MRPLFLAVLAALALPATAQDAPRAPQGENLATPPTWSVRVDAPHAEHGDDAHHTPTVGADSTFDIRFVNMTPGWHITTGPAGIFWHPASTASGLFQAETKVHLFDPGERREAFGLLVGGTDLDGDAPRYDYFVIRQGGEFLVKRRDGDATTTLVPWTAHDAIVAYAPGDGAVANTLAVDVGAAEVAFSINGAEVARLPRGEVRTDGIVGLRVNHALNLHVETFAVAPTDG